MRIVDILTRAKAIVTHKDNWTQGEYARNARGNQVQSDDPTAVCWCASGAIERAGGNIGTTNYAHQQPTGTAICAFAQTLPDDHWDGALVPLHAVVNFNDADSTSHSDVLAAFDKSIKEASTDD